MILLSSAIFFKGPGEKSTTRELELSLDFSNYLDTFQRGEKKSTLIFLPSPSHCKVTIKKTFKVAFRSWRYTGNISPAGDGDLARSRSCYRSAELLILDS